LKITIISLVNRPIASENDIKIKEALANSLDFITCLEQMAEQSQSAAQIDNQSI
jgi:hypothetical protein